MLEVRFVTADGRLVKGGGPTVKNVSGFDLPRLLVGSLGTIGVIVQTTLRCQPRPETAAWFADRRRSVRGPPRHLPARRASRGTATAPALLLEGIGADVAAERAAIGAPSEPSPPPAWPTGTHRGRISVRPSALPGLAPALDAAGVRWLAEVGVGTVHVAADDEPALAVARAAAAGCGGWLLREAGAPSLDGFGRALPNAKLMERVRAAFDPTAKLSPGRLPIGSADD